MSRAQLSLVRPEKIDADSVLAHVKHFASEAMEEYNQAENRAKLLKLQYNSLADLMTEAQIIKEKKGLSPEDLDELENIVDVSIEIMESIQRIHKGESLTDGAIDLDSDQPELPSSGKSAATKFLQVYSFYKAKLGLKTQDDVAKLLGMNRRYVSTIESGKFKPQFKTLKRLADAFGVDVSVFMN